MPALNHQVAVHPRQQQWTRWGVKSVQGAFLFVSGRFSCFKCLSASPVRHWSAADPIGGESFGQPGLSWQQRSGAKQAPALAEDQAAGEINQS